MRGSAGEGATEQGSSSHVLISSLSSRPVQGLALEMSARSLRARAATQASLYVLFKSSSLLDTEVWEGPAPWSEGSGGPYEAAPAITSLCPLLGEWGGGVACLLCAPQV